MLATLDGKFTSASSSSWFYSSIHTLNGFQHCLSNRYYPFLEFEFPEFSFISLYPLTSLDFVVQRCSCEPICGLSQANWPFQVSILMLMFWNYFFCKKRFSTHLIHRVTCRTCRFKSSLDVRPLRAFHFDVGFVGLSTFTSFWTFNPRLLRTDLRTSSLWIDPFRVFHWVSDVLFR